MSLESSPSTLIGVRSIKAESVIKTSSISRLKTEGVIVRSITGLEEINKGGEVLLSSEVVVGTSVDVGVDSVTTLYSGESCNKINSTNINKNKYPERRLNMDKRLFLLICIIKYYTPEPILCQDYALSELSTEIMKFKLKALMFSMLRFPL